MDKKVLKITQGALMTAIFGVMVFLNRQTAGFIQEILIYIYPLPIAVYVARYGILTGIPAAVAMTFISLFLSLSPLSAFYAVASLFTGLVFGECLYRKAGAGATIGLVMAASVLVNLFDLLFMSKVSGLTLDKQAAEMQQMMDEVLSQYQDTMAGMGGMTAENEAVMDQTMQMVSSVFTTDYVERIIVISTVFLGIVQGFLIYEIGLLIMRRLRIRVAKPKNIYEIRPPFWTAYVALGFFFLYVFGLTGFQGQEAVRNLCVTLGMTGYLFLVIFGVLGLSLLLRRWIHGRFLPVILSFLAVFILPYLVMGVGFLYISGLTDLFPKAEKKEASPPIPAVSGNFRPDYLILVNPTHGLPEGYHEAIQPYLKEITAHDGQTAYCEERTRKAFLDLKEALAEDGVTVAFGGGYRTREEQERIMEKTEKEFGRDYALKYVAVPGHSEHEAGLAVDVFLVKDGKVLSKREDLLAEPELWEKVHERIAGFGFILRYPEGKESVTGIAYEPWHFRFVGEAAAGRMAWHELTLEEYLEKYPAK